MLSKLDRKIISLVSCDIPLVQKPFQELAHRLGIQERFLLSRLKFYRKNGLMRKFTATLNHRKIGYKYNAMAVWNIPVQSIEKAGTIMASFAEVSHCYQRRKKPDWNYNLYSMIHGTTKKDCLDVVRQISKKTAGSDYRVLFSSKEYKKTGVKY